MTADVVTLRTNPRVRPWHESASQVVDHGHCFYCERPWEPGQPVWAVPSASPRSSYGLRVCAMCAVMELELVDARYEGRRFSEVACVERCECGGVIVYALLRAKPLRFSCVQCYRDYKMLRKARAELARTRRILKELNREVREWTADQGDDAQPGRRARDPAAGARRPAKRAGERGTGEDRGHAGGCRAENRRGSAAVRAAGQ